MEESPVPVAGGFIPDSHPECLLLAHEHDHALSASDSRI
jgi:hypothetical protein